MVIRESEASETTEIDPEALPPEVGVKTAPKVKLCPGLRLKGKFNPVTRKPVPETFAWLMVTLEPPVFVTGGGAAWLRGAGVTVAEFPELAAQARAVNAHLLAG